MATRIYTRTGDDGETGLFGGQRVSKNDARVEAYGSVDELNSLLGVVRAQAADADLQALLARVQSSLLIVGADLATPDEGRADRGGSPVPRLEPSHTAALESDIDRLEGELVPLKRFILPGGCPLAAAAHFARAVCRRAERRCVGLAGQQPINDEIVRYLNRLSDLLFVLARVTNSRAGVADVTWEGR